MSADNRSIYFSREELAVVERALTLYAVAHNGGEFSDEPNQVEPGMRARHNLAKSARGKIKRERANR